MQTLQLRQDSAGERIWDWIADYKVRSACILAAVLLRFAEHNAYSRLADMQTPDLAYDTRVANPAYRGGGLTANSG